MISQQVEPPSSRLTVLLQPACGLYHVIQLPSFFKLWDLSLTTRHLQLTDGYF